MFSVVTRRFVEALLVLVVAAVFASGSSPSVTRAQNAGRKPAQAAPPATQVEEPRYREYRKVRLGMPASDVHSALGTPKEVEGRQEFYAISETPGTG